MEGQVDEISLDILKIKSEELADLVEKLRKSELAFGLIRDSNSTDFSVVVCSPDEVIPFTDKQNIADFNSSPGFIAFPFDIKTRKAYFLPSTFEISDLEDLEQNLDESDQKIGHSTIKDFYKNGVSNAVESISKGEFEKLVFGRKLEFLYPKKSIKPLINKLIASYPKAHISIFKIPGEGLWISASPEVLLEKSMDTEILETMALAGTMLFQGQNLKVHGWTEKEIEEQSLVSRFIKDRLIETGHFEFEEKGPSTIQAGNLLHLRTDYKVKALYKNSFYLLANALHPTSAVCGSPRDEAFQWLSNNEDFDREFFSGFAGIVGQNYGKLVVLLRAGKLEKGIMTLFAGAGITASSNPDAEWTETEEKMKTLLDILI